MQVPGPPKKGELPGPEPDWPVPEGKVRKVCGGCQHWFVGTGASLCATCRATGKGSGGATADTYGDTGRRVGGS